MSIENSGNLRYFILSNMPKIRLTRRCLLCNRASTKHQDYGQLLQITCQPGNTTSMLHSTDSSFKTAQIGAAPATQLPESVQNNC